MVPKLTSVPLRESHVDAQQHRMIQSSQTDQGCLCISFCRVTSAELQLVAMSVPEVRIDDHPAERPTTSDEPGPVGEGKEEDVASHTVRSGLIA